MARALNRHPVGVLSRSQVLRQGRLDIHAGAGWASAPNVARQAASSSLATTVS